jgi:hypothetical protein
MRRSPPKPTLIEDMIDNIVIYFHDPNCNASVPPVKGMIHYHLHQLRPLRGKAKSRG